MSTFAASFKSEVIRLARKEAKVALTPIRKPSGANRKAIADLKRRVATLEKECRRLGSLLAKVPQPQAAPAEGQQARITAKGMRSLQKHLRLSGSDFAKLLGVTSQIVYKWSKAEGPLRVRANTRAAILSVRGLGAREAKERLVGMTEGKKVARKGRRK